MPRAWCRIARNRNRVCRRAGLRAVKSASTYDLRTSRRAEDRQLIDALCEKSAMSRQQLGERLSQRLGVVTLNIIEQARIGGLFLTGGDIATAVAGALGAEGYRIQSEVAPCIPCGTFVNSEIDDLPVITKAGGFGSDSTLCDALYYIEEMYCGD